MSEVRHIDPEGVARRRVKLVASSSPVATVPRTAAAAAGPSALSSRNGAVLVIRTGRSESSGENGVRGSSCADDFLAQLAHDHDARTGGQGRRARRGWTGASTHLDVRIGLEDHRSPPCCGGAGWGRGRCTRPGSDARKERPAAGPAPIRTRRALDLADGAAAHRLWRPHEGRRRGSPTIVDHGLRLRRTTSTPPSGQRCEQAAATESGGGGRRRRTNAMNLRAEDWQADGAPSTRTRQD